MSPTAGVQITLALFDTIFVVFDTFIRPDLFGSLTENDATGGADMDRPTRDLFCEENVDFEGKPQNPILLPPPPPPRPPY